MGEHPWMICMWLYDISRRNVPDLSGFTNSPQLTRNVELAFRIARVTAAIAAQIIPRFILGLYAPQFESLRYDHRFEVLDEQTISRAAKGT
jgi:hypothetical protein